MSIGELSGAVGRGLMAGVVGTAAMTLVSTIEMKVRGREASDTPAKAASKVLGVEPKSESEKQRFSNLIHWAYGTSWGAARGLIGAAGLNSIPANSMHFAAVWGTALWMLPALKVAPPPTEWGMKELVLDALHHVVYVTATGITFDRFRSDCDR